MGRLNGRIVTRRRECGQPMISIKHLEVMRKLSASLTVSVYRKRVMVTLEWRIQGRLYRIERGYDTKETESMLDELFETAEHTHARLS